MTPVRVGPAGPEHAGELFTVQRAAYVSEAQRYAAPDIPPLVEPLERVVADLAAPDVLTFGAWLGARLVGSVRGRPAGDRLEVARFAVAPDLQGRGIGTALLAAVEAAAPPGIRTLWLTTGARSEPTLRLYERSGYRRVAERTDAAGVALILLEKPVQAG